MATLQTPIQRSVLPQAVPQPDANAGALEQVGRVADEVQQFGFAKIAAANADRLNTTLLDGTKQLDDLKTSFMPGGANATDPVTAESRFNDGAAKIKDNLFGQLPDEQSQRAFTEHFDNLSEARSADVSSEALRQQNQDAKVNLLDATDTYTNQAAAAQNPNERYAIVSQASDAITKGIKTGVITAADAHGLVKGFHQGLAKLDARRMVDADPASAETFLRDYDNLPDLDPQVRETEIERAQAEVLARQREAHAQLRDARADARQSLEDLETINRSGQPVDPQTADAARAKVTAAQDPTIAARYNTLVRASNVMTGLRGATPSDLQGAISQLEQQAGANGADAKTAATLIAARQFAAAQSTGLRDDPLMYAQGQGRVQITPLQLNGSDQADAWQQRVQQANRVAQYYGIKPTYLIKAETDTLKGALAPNQPVAARLHIAQGLVSALGSRSLAIFSEIAPHDPVVANAGALMVKGNTSAARDAITGQSLLSSAADGKQSDLRPLPGGRNLFSDAPQISTALGFGLQDGRGQVLSTADAIYAARASAHGFNGASVGNGDTHALSLYNRSLNEAVGARYDDAGNQYGGLSSYRGMPVIAPGGIPSGSFEDAVHGLSDRALSTHSVSGAPPVNADGSAVKAADMGRLYVVTVGDDRYRLSSTDPRQSLTPIMDAHGRPYTFSLMDAFDHPKAAAKP